ncbi:hypothetical protein GCM10025789_08960 [Tessaracoccus lubricantis]|uniref:Uncharacterized protein n=1 Tax=Tessaracoccus lubricantis TaxID=545543 RepID=A0ABP9F6A3_9ACTN
MHSLQLERIPVLEERLLERSPRLGLLERIAMRIGLWMLIWSVRFDRSEDDRLVNQEYLDREARELHYLQLLERNRPF